AAHARSAQVHGRVRDGRAEGLAAVTVTLIDTEGHQRGRVRTEAGGHYRLDAPGMGHYTVMASAPGFRPDARVATVTSTDGASEDLTLVAVPRVRGTTRSTAHRPVPDAMVTVLDTAGHPIAATHTDYDGRFELDVPTEGDYTLIASGYPPAVSAVRVTKGIHTTHDIALHY
ncbi:MAG: MSCRAMM family protein, partial [Sciscionella sp.]